jgi:phosphomannomutase
MRGAAALLGAARAWRDEDPDPETRAELDALVTDAEAGSTDALDALHSRFDTRLEFGTAGLRGALAAGPNRMNRVLVAQAAAGFAAFLLARAGDGHPTPSVVIGYDGRKNSEVFATDTAELMAGAGVRAILLPRLLPTPVLAFAVRHLGVSAGVMVTASHNPPNDNGYKVYLGGADDGSQIVPPADTEIEASIQRVAATTRVPELTRSRDNEMAGEEVVDEYVRRTVGLVRHPDAAAQPAPAATARPDARAPSNRPLASAAPVRFVYTALHGVGWETARRVFADAGFGEPIVVAEQIQPDPAFPTVAFPNPEEPGALDLAYATATEAGAELIIANDPDADRLAVAVPDPREDTGWRRLSGNEVGWLLGWRAAERLREAGTAIAAVGGDTGTIARGVLAASIVSSPALAEVARQYQLDYADTLTGFKWVSRVPGLSYGYEEALGYLVDPGKVRDKDGISAALEFLALVADLKAQGRTFEDHARAFAERFGGFASSQVSVRVTDIADIPRIMSGIRTETPARLGSVAVTGVDDFANGLGGFPPSDILRFRLEDGSRVIVRPSGTEPKVKVYLDASSAAGTAEERLATARAAVDALEVAVRELLS